MQTVLIVEDASFLSDLIEKFCNELGYSVLGVAKDGEEAITKAIEFHPDIILMDLVLPTINGVDATKTILQTLPRAQVIGVSSLNDSWIFEQMEEVGFVGFLEKPFTKQDLGRALSEIQTQMKEVANG